MIPMIQWPPRRVTANIDNSYEYQEMSSNPTQGDISHAINGDNSLPTAGINYQLAAEMQLRSRYTLMSQFASKELYTKLEMVCETSRLHYTMINTNKAVSRDNLQSAVIGSRMKPTYECEAAYRKWTAHWRSAPMKVMKVAHLRRRMKPISGAEQWHYPSTYTEEILSTN